MKFNRFLKAAAALWAVAVLTGTLWVNFTVARYATQANLAASAQVAGWDIRVTGPAGLTSFRNGSHNFGETTRQFTVSNLGDVTANVTLRLVVSTNPNEPVTANSPAAVIGADAINNLGILAPAPGVTHQGGRTWRFEPGASAAFFVQLQATPTPSQTQTTTWYREFLVVADAVQID